MSGMESPQVLLSQKQINAGVHRLAGELTDDYRGKNPLLVGVLNGCFIFLADLVRRVATPVEIDFIRLCSYGAGTETSGTVRLECGTRRPIEGRHVVLIEDIVDTGFTTSFALQYLAEGRPASLKLCALADKPTRHRVDITIDYLGFTLPDRFVVGYGLDLNEAFRYLSDLCYVEDDR